MTDPVKPPSNLATWEALDAWMRGCLKIKSAQKWQSPIIKFLKKSFPAQQKSFCIFLYNFGDCIVICKNHVAKPRDSFAQIWKMTECPFWADVMLRQPCIRPIRASRASPASKWPGLRVVLFQKLCFLGESLRYIFELFAHETNLKKKSAVWICSLIFKIPGTHYIWKLKLL